MSIAAQLQAAIRACQADDQEACAVIPSLQQQLQEEQIAGQSDTAYGYKNFGAIGGLLGALGLGGLSAIKQKELQSLRGANDVMGRKQYASGGQVHTCPLCGK